MNVTEQLFRLEVGGESLVAIVHEPGGTRSGCGVVIVVGGPQYRVGSHRQFVLLARSLAARGIPVLRFDLVGMGDSTGEALGFERADAAIRTAVDAFVVKAGVRSVCLWGLCDGASAALMYAASDARVSALVLANPWVRSDSGQAQAYLDAYYGRRIRSASFWRKMLSQPARVPRAMLEFVVNFWRARGNEAGSRANVHARPFIERMADGGERFAGRMLVLLSGRDLVATEFELALQRWPRWGRIFAPPRVGFARNPDANHTFSRRVWRDWVADQTAEFVSAGND